jgi:hypothetical protein
MGHNSHGDGDYKHDKDDNEGNDADYNNDDDHHHDPPPATTQGKRLTRRTCAWHATMWHA